MWDNSNIPVVGINKLSSFSFILWSYLFLAWVLSFSFLKDQIFSADSWKTLSYLALLIASIDSIPAEEGGFHLTVTRWGQSSSSIGNLGVGDVHRYCCKSNKCSWYWRENILLWSWLSEKNVRCSIEELQLTREPPLTPIQERLITKKNWRKTWISISFTLTSS